MFGVGSPEKGAEGARASGSRSFVYHALFLSAAFFFPPLPGVFGGFVVGQRIYLAAMVGLVIPGLVWSILLDRRPLSGPGVTALVFVLVTTIYFIGTTLVFSGRLTAGDVIDLLRPLVYLVFFIFPLVLPLSEKESNRLFAFLLFLLVIQVGISALVFWPQAWPFLDLYKGRGSGDLSPLQFYRFSGTFGFPGNFGLYLVLGLAAIWVRINGLSSLRERALLFLAGAALLAGLSLSGSRTGLGALALMGIPLAGRTGWRGIALLSGALVLALALASQDGVKGAWSEYGQYSQRYVTRLLDEGVAEGSAGHRMREMDLAWAMASERPPFGLGPNRTFIQNTLGPVESFYGHYLAKFGFLGVLLWAPQFLWISWLAREAVHRGPVGSWIGSWMWAFSWWVPITVLVLGLVTSTADQFRGTVIFYALAGHAASLAFPRNPCQWRAQRGGYGG